MQDQPTAIELLEIVAEFIRKVAVPGLSGHASFHALVAANAVDIVRRELEIAPSADEEERRRIAALIGQDGDLATLNEALCARIADGTLDASTPGLADHLWKTTMTKLAIDQPNYSSYRRAVETNSGGRG
jgi:hypothetical protein